MDIIKVILTSLLSILALFVTTKLMGHKQLAQLDFFDYIVGITVGSVAAELATELEEPWKPLIALIVYCAISVILDQITHKFPKSRKYINGSPSIILNDGKIFRRNMKKAKLDLSEFMVMCREQGYFDINDIKTAIFEHNGKLTVLPKSISRPITPDDINLVPKQQHINTEIIMDGRILEENLKRRGLDRKWLQSQLKRQGYSDANQVFLGICNEQNKLTLFSIN